jgi:hypothetical protein
MSLFEIEAEIPNLTLAERRRLAQQLARLEEDQGIEDLALARFQSIDQEEKGCSRE